MLLTHHRCNISPLHPSNGWPTHTCNAAFVCFPGVPAGHSVAQQTEHQAECSKQGAQLLHRCQKLISDGIGVSLLLLQKACIHYVSLMAASAHLVSACESSPDCPLPIDGAARQNLSASAVVTILEVSSFHSRSCACQSQSADQTTWQRQIPCLF